MTNPQGPGTPFQLLFSDEIATTPSLPEAFSTIYPSDWHIPTIKDRPYIYTDFAMSRDGRISYSEPGRESGYYVTQSNPHDRWMMGLLRMRAEAFMVGDTTLKLEGYHLASPQGACPWTAEFICPSDAEAFAAQRKAEGLRPIPLLVVLSLEGNVDFSAGCFAEPACQIVLATTTLGARQARQLGLPANVDVHTLGETEADLSRLAQILYSDYGIRQLLCEGGSIVLANLLKAGLVDEEFLTWCPTFVGRTRDKHRPSYTEGIAWLPETTPLSKPFTLHRGGDCLFLRTRCQYRS